VENQQNQSVPTLAGMLAGLAILAAGGSDAGIATIAATQAAAVQSQLAHSRLHETEADRFGMDILVRAGMDPEAMPRMFEEMLDAKRFSGTKYPEFLLTHPLTEKRVSDTKTRARNFLKVEAEPTLAFYLMRSRVLQRFAESPQQAVRMFRAELSNSFHDYEIDANRYGLVLSLIDTRELDEAGTELKKLLAKAPMNTAYQLAAADILNANNQHAEAAKLLRSQLMISPNSHPITMALGETYILNSEPKAAADLLEIHSRKYNTVPSVWYDLAEAKGLAGDILGVHIARAEYFLLNGILDEAGKQLTYAMNLAQGDFMQTAKLEQRMRFLEELRQVKL
jgi:predicted Zn-dependent protease